MSLEGVLAVSHIRDRICGLLVTPYGTGNLRLANRAISRCVDHPTKKFRNADALLFLAAATGDCILATYALETGKCNVYVMDHIARLAFRCGCFDVGMVITNSLPSLYGANLLDMIEAGAIKEFVQTARTRVVCGDWRDLCSAAIRKRSPEALHVVAANMVLSIGVLYPIMKCVEDGWSEGADIMVSYMEPRERAAVYKDILAHNDTHPKAEAWARAKKSREKIPFC